MKMRAFILSLFIVITATSVSANEMDSYLSKGARVEERCSDATFLRRSYLLLNCEIPTMERVKAFVADGAANKREALIDDLLQSDGHIRYMQMRWGDILRIKSEFPSNLWPNGVQAYNQWVYRHLLENTPYDDMVCELLLSKGSNFKAPAVNFYRAFLKRSPQNVYENINLLFLGQRSYVDNGYECFSQIRYKATREWKEEIIYLDMEAKLPYVMLSDGTSLDLKERSDWRDAYVDWLTSQERFAAVQVNRVWYWIFGRGLVDEVDDWRADNPAREPKLLAHLTDYFIKSGYDTRALMRYILTSDCYSARAEVGSLFEPRRASAEAIVDAIADITGVSERYTSRVPEPFTIYPLNTRSRDLGDATVSSSELELFGKVSRDVSLESQRNNSVNSRQLLYLMNSSHLEQSVRHSPLAKRLNVVSMPKEQVVQEAMMTILSRPATEAEVEMFVKDFARRGLKRSEMVSDLIWVLLNSNEFLYIY